MMTTTGSCHRHRIKRRIGNPSLIPSRTRNRIPSRLNDQHTFNIGCLLFIAILTIISEPTMACSSRAITKPRPTTLPSSVTTPRPNITFPIFNCPPTYAAWYCLNDATCFTVEIHNEILYNCECAIGFMGPRCEYKEIDGSYLPTRQRVMLEKASIASGATLALLLMFIVCLTLYIRHEKKLKKLNETTPIGHENAGMDEVDTGPGLRPFGPHHYKERILVTEMSENTPLHQQQQQAQPQSQALVLSQSQSQSQSQPLCQLQTSNEGDLGPPKADFSAPPPYELTNSNLTELDGQQTQQSQQQQQQLLTSQQAQQQQQQQSEIAMLHGKLPTYEEVQMEKSLNGELPPAFLTGHGMMPSTLPPPPPNPLLADIRDGNGSMGNGGNGTPALTFIAIDASDAENLANGDNSLLGTDIMFITAFMVAFLFNWIGFLMLTCFCHTIAARYGALSGFGLSLAKWTLIVKHSTDLASQENSWLWWLIMAFGFLICVRALIQYVSIKRTWRLLSTSAQERLLFFY